MKTKLIIALLLFSNYIYSNTTPLIENIEGEPYFMTINNDFLYVSINNSSGNKIIRYDLDSKFPLAEEVLKGYWSAGQLVSFGNSILFPLTSYEGDKTVGKIIEVNILDNNFEIKEIYQSDFQIVGLQKVNKDTLLFSDFSENGGIFSLDISNNLNKPKKLINNLHRPGLIAYSNNHLWIAYPTSDKVEEYEIIEDLFKKKETLEEMGRTTSVKIYNNSLFIVQREKKQIIKIDLNTLEKEKISIINQLNDPVDIEFLNEKIYISEYNNRLILQADRVLSSINNEDKENPQIFPNPAKDYISLNNNYRNSDLYIYNIEGKLVMSIPHVNGSNIDISNLNSGNFYILSKDNFVGIFIKE